MTHWMEDERDVTLKKLCSTTRAFLDKLPDILGWSKEAEGAVVELECLIEEIEHRYERDDPRSMGWVGDDGLP